MPSKSDDDSLQAIREALFQNRKIEAIKIYRQQTGASLVESKTLIDKLEAELRLMSPEKFQASKQGAGCQAFVILAAIAALALIWWLVSK